MTSVLLCDGNANGQWCDTKAHEGDTIEVAGSRYTIGRWGLNEELVGFCDDCDDVDYPEEDMLRSES
jgi:hypothetical protein